MVLSGVGQSFTMVGNKNLGKVKFYINKTGSPTGTLIARLYHGILDGFGRYIPDDDPINGSILAHSDLLDMDDIDVIYRWEDFVFSGDQQYSLVNGVVYVVQLEVYESDDIDVSNNIHVWGTLDPTCCTGNESGYKDNVWTSWNYDVCMRVYDADINLLYLCDQTGCAGGYGYDTLNGVFPYIPLPTPEFPIQPQGGERYIEFLICNTCGAEIGQSEFHCTRSPFEGLTCFCDKCGGRVYP